LLLSFAVISTHAAAQTPSETHAVNPSNPAIDKVETSTPVTTVKTVPTPKLKLKTGVVGTDPKNIHDPPDILSAEKTISSAKKVKTENASQTTIEKVLPPTKTVKIDSEITQNTSENISAEEEHKTQPEANPTIIIPSSKKTSNDEHKKAKTKATKPPSIQGDILKVSLNYGAHEKLLKSCHGRIENIEAKISGTNFSSDSVHYIIPKKAWPHKTKDSDAIKLVFDGDDAFSPARCQTMSPTSATLTAKGLRKILRSNTPHLSLEPPRPLFVAYVNLQSGKIKSSIGRWREALETVNDIYRQGYADKIWSDGIIVTSGKDGIQLLHTPNANFSDEIITKTQSIALSRDLSRRDGEAVLPRNTVTTLSQHYTADGKNALLYISDEFSSCRDLTSNFFGGEDMPFAHKGFIFALADNSSESGSVTLDETGLLSTCASMEDRHVMGFNLYERVVNLDWGTALRQAAIMLKDTKAYKNK